MTQSTGQILGSLSGTPSHGEERMICPACMLLKQGIYDWLVNHPERSSSTTPKLTPPTFQVSSVWTCSTLDGTTP